MLKTLVVYSGKYGSTEEVAKTISMITGPAKYCKTEDFNENYHNFEFVVLGAPVYEEKIDPSMVEFVKQYREWLKERSVSAFCTCLDKNGGLRELNELSFSSGVNFLTLKALGGRLILDKLDEVDHEAIKKFLELVKLPFEDIDFYNKKEVIDFALKLKDLKEDMYLKVDADKLEDAVDKFIESHNTCTLASCHDGSVRSTPIEYNYIKKHLYLLSEGGEKFSNLLLNDNVSVSIYNPYTGMDNLAGMQIKGKASLIPEDSDEYSEILKIKGVSADSVKSLLINMNMIKIQIIKVEYLNSKFKAMGADPNQIMKF